MKRVITVAVLSLVLILAGSQAGRASDDHGNGGNQNNNNGQGGGGNSWNIEYRANTQLGSSQFEESLCTASSEVVSNNPAPRLQRWDAASHAWKISINRADVLRANPNCPAASYINSQADSIAPLSQNLFDQLYQQGDYRVMYPGRQATWSGLAVSPSFIQTGTIGSTGWGFQSAEPVSLLPNGDPDPTSYRVIAASFALVASTDPLASQVLNGGVQARPHCFVYDFANGLTYEELLTDYPPEFFTHPHNYAIDWVQTGRVANTSRPAFDLVFYIDGDEVARYHNGSTQLSKLAVATFLGYGQVGADAPINAKRWSQPRATQVYAWANNSTSSTGFVNNGAIPPVPLELSLQGMAIERSHNH